MSTRLISQLAAVPELQPNGLLELEQDDLSYHGTIQQILNLIGVESVGTGNAIFQERADNSFKFKSIVAGDNITITSLEDTLTIAATSSAPTVAGANLTLSNLGITAITQHLNFGLNVGFQTPAFQLLQQNNSLFLQTKTGTNRLIISATGFQFDPQVGVIFSNKRVGEIRNPLANDEAANKRYVDTAIAAIPTTGPAVAGANHTLSNLTDPVAINQDLTFNKLAPSIYLRATGGGLHFNSYSMIESGVDLRIFETTNNEHGIVITPQTLQLVSSNGVNINNKRLLNLATPTNDNDAANKKYVDDNSGANTELSNLDPNTLIDQDLTFSDGTKGIIFPRRSSIVENSTLGIRISSPSSSYSLRVSDNEVDFFTSISLDTARVNFNGMRIIGLRNPTNNQDAATKKYVDDNAGSDGANLTLSNLGVTAINNHLNLAGTNRLNFANGGSLRPENNTNALGIYAGNKLTSLFDDNGIIFYTPLNMGSNKITALGTPTANDDAATKLYVDENSGGTVNFDELEGTLDNTQIPESEINISKLNAVGSDGGLMFVSSDGTISQIGNNATINQILVWAGGGWQPRDQLVIPAQTVYAARDLSNLTDPIAFNQHLVFSVDDSEITFKNGSTISSSGNPRIFGTGVQILSSNRLNGLIITDTAIGFELLSENRKEIHFGNLKLMNALDPTADQDVATKHYVDNHAGVGGATTSLSNLTTTAITEELIFVDGTKGITFGLGGKLNHTTGGVRLRGGDEGVLTSIITLAPTEITLFSVLGLNMSNKKIRNLAAPTNDADASTKKYVDDRAGGANIALSNLGSDTALTEDLNFIGSGMGIAFDDGTRIELLSNAFRLHHDNNYIGLSDAGFMVGGDWNFNSTRVHGLPTPILGSSAATKAYVDNKSLSPSLDNLSTITQITQDLTFSALEKGLRWRIGSRVYESEATANRPELVLQGGTGVLEFDSSNLRIAGRHMVFDTPAIFFGNIKLQQVSSPIVDTDAANKAYVDSRPRGALNFGGLGGSIDISQIPNDTITSDKLAAGIFSKITGLNTQAQILNMGSNKITNVTNPTADSDAATKAYVDNSGSGGATTRLNNLSQVAINATLKFNDQAVGIEFLNESDIKQNNERGMILSSSGQTPQTLTLDTTGIFFNSSNIEFGNVILHGLATPTADSDAANKAYVDNNGAAGANTRLNNLSNVAINSKLKFNDAAIGIEFLNESSIIQNAARGMTLSNGNKSTQFVIGDDGFSMNQDLVFTKRNSGIIFRNGSIVKEAGSGIQLSDGPSSAHIISITASGGIGFNSGRLRNVGNPTALTDAANKNYVDTQISGIATGGGTVNFNEIQGTIDTAQYGNNTISTEKLQNLSITGAKIAVKSININKLSVSSGESLDKGICLYNLAATDFTLGGLSDVAGSLGLSQIDATGNRSANTFLRGDGTWSPTASGGSSTFSGLIGTIALNQIPNSLITLAKINASGTRNNTTFLRGDNTWAAISSGGVNNFNGLAGTITLDQIPNALITIDKISAAGVRDATTFLRGDGTFVNIPAGTSGGVNTELSNLDANTLINQDLNFAKTDGKIVFQNGAEVRDHLSTGIQIRSHNSSSNIVLNSNSGVFITSASGSTSFNNARLAFVGNPTGQQDAATKNYVDTAITNIPAGFNQLTGTLALGQIPDSLITLAKLSATGTKDNTTFFRGDNTFVPIPATNFNQLSGALGLTQIPDSLITLGKLSATGTKDATTFLRGDGTFAAIPVRVNTELSNLDANTLINQDLNFAKTDGKIVFGNGAKVGEQANGGIGVNSANNINNITVRNTGVFIISASGVSINGASGFIDFNSNRLSNVVNPTAQQDAVTLNYLRGYSPNLASTQIPDNIITASKLNRSGATEGQVLKWSDAANAFVPSDP